MLHSASQTIHMGAYITDSDPGAVGAKVLWITATAPYVIKKRNDADAAWDTLGTLVVPDGDQGILASQIFGA